MIRMTTDDQPPTTVPAAPSTNLQIIMIFSLRQLQKIPIYFTLSSLLEHAHVCVVTETTQIPHLVALLRGRANQLHATILLPLALPNLHEQRVRWGAR